MLRYLERIIHPRWLTPFEATKRIVGGVVLLLGVCLLAPVHGGHSSHLADDERDWSPVTDGRQSWRGATLVN
jgi:hypothetical protein